MWRAILRGLFLALVRLFYPRRVVEGAERLPAAGPVILLANHPNGLLDPMLLRLGVRRPVRFLAKSTFFRHPIGRAAMAAFGCFPVYRQQDQATEARAPETPRADRNEETFARCRDALAAGDWLALFPEGTSHSDPQLRPLRTGAARIALSAADLKRGPAGAPLPVALVPVGLAYDDKTVFRTGAFLRIGAPLSLDARLGEYARDPRAAVEALTDEIREALDAVVLQAETRDLLQGVARVAAWTSEDAARAADPALQDQRARRLLEAYRQVQARDPDATAPIVRAARHYARVLRTLGVDDPWALDVQAVAPARIARAVITLGFAAPLALIGAILGWFPYRLAGRVAARVATEEDVLGTVKLVAGALFVAVAWILELTAAAIWLGPIAALAVAILAPLGGYAALRFEEIAGQTAEALRHAWLRRSRPAALARLEERRRALADAITRALAVRS